MKTNAELVVKLRKNGSWSQEELALASGLNLRTIQRIEKEASTSLQSRKALASALDVDIHDLNIEEMHMKSCTICKSENVYQYKESFEFNGLGAGLLPDLGKSVLGLAKNCLVICADCGYVTVFESIDTRKQLATSKHWKEV
jgi:transcriptional regulator with XRE-family HTH domain